MADYHPQLLCLICYLAGAMCSGTAASDTFKALDLVPSDAV